MRRHEAGGSQRPEHGGHQGRARAGAPRLGQRVDGVELAPFVAVATLTVRREADDGAVLLGDEDGLGLRLGVIEALPPALLPDAGLDGGEPLRTEDVRVRSLPGPGVDPCDCRSVFDLCRPDLQRYLPAEEETYCATAWI